MNNKIFSEYLQSLPEERQQKLQELHTLIMSLYPDADVSMRYKMPTYESGDGWVALASQKHYVSLYTCGYAHIEPFKKQHPDIKTGKGCINFKDKDDLPLDDLKQVVKHAIEHPKA